MIWKSIFRRPISLLIVALLGLTVLSQAALSQGNTKPEIHGSAHAFFPNTETVQPDEMRITALGSGLPTPLTRVQKSTSWMVELGNGDVFIFDVGTGSMENLFGLRPDFSKIDKVFLSHLHTDHLAIWTHLSSEAGLVVVTLLCMSMDHRGRYQNLAPRRLSKTSPG